MKDITMLILKDCPYCIRAFEYIDRLKADHPEYQNLQIQVIDEEAEPERAREYDYWYVPTFFVDGEKIHEGVKDLKLIDDVFQKASA